MWKFEQGDVSCAHAIYLLAETYPTYSIFTRKKTWTKRSEMGENYNVEMKTLISDKQAPQTHQIIS